MRVQITEAFLKLVFMYSLLVKRIKNINRVFIIFILAVYNIFLPVLIKIGPYANIAIFFFTYNFLVITTYKTLRKEYNTNRFLSVLTVTIITFMQLYFSYATWESQIDQALNGSDYDRVVANNKKKEAAFLNIRACLEVDDCNAFKCIFKNGFEYLDANELVSISDFAKTRITSEKCSINERIFRDPEGAECGYKVEDFNATIRKKDNSIGLSFSSSRDAIDGFNFKKRPTWCNQGNDLPVRRIFSFDKNKFKSDRELWASIKTTKELNKIASFYNALPDDSPLINDVENILMKNGDNRQKIPALIPSSIGNGPVKIAIILPLSEDGKASPMGLSMLHAAELAYSEFNFSETTILVKDDRSTSAGAKEAVEEAIKQGAELIIGPVSAKNIKGVADIVLSKEIPLIALSSDDSVASHGIYVFGISVNEYVDRVIEYVAEKGATKIAMIGAEGDLNSDIASKIEAEAGRRNLLFQKVELYKPGEVSQAANNIEKALPDVDVLLLSDRPTEIPAVADALANITIPRNLKIIGLDGWDRPEITGKKVLDGAVFVRSEAESYKSFLNRYYVKFGFYPKQMAAMSYDAVSLIVTLAKDKFSFSKLRITDSGGFEGVSSLYRLNPDGMSERRFSLMKIVNKKVVTIVSRPTKF